MPNADENWPAYDSKTGQAVDEGCDRHLLLITGAGRSGTSAVTGVLHHLGVHVPGPYLRANATNPRGFYESKWSVTFHNELLKRAFVALTDGRPEAQSKVAAAISDLDREQLRAWMRSTVAGHRLSAVKDPRTSWTLDLWAELAAELEIGLTHIVMLRHPAEVVGSRTTHYGHRKPGIDADDFAVKNLAGWINSLLRTERATRHRPRMFVHYDDLVRDWRTTALRLQTMLNVDLSVPGTSESHLADTFIDADLNRHRVGWDAVAMRPDLQRVAERIWQACCRLAVDDTHASSAVNDLDAAQYDYEVLYHAAQQLARDHTTAQVAAAKRAARRDAQHTSAVKQPETAQPSRHSKVEQSLVGKLLRRLSRNRHPNGKTQ